MHYSATKFRTNFLERDTLWLIEIANNNEGRWHEARSKILHSENIKKAALAERSLFVNQLMTIHKT